MRSIRTQLVAWLVTGIVLLSCAAGAGLYEYMKEVLQHGLDSALAARADAIAGAVHMEEDGQPHLEIADVVGAAAAGDDGPFYYQIWRADGRTLALKGPPSKPLDSLPRPRKANKAFSNGFLSDGTAARLVHFFFLAQPDEDQPDTTKPNTTPAQPLARPLARLELVVAHGRQPTASALDILLGGLGLTLLVLTIGTFFIVTLGVRRGLRPLDQVSMLADRIGPDSLDLRFPTHQQIPEELRPIGLKLNDLLDRLESAFARERRFSAAVAHELRTPLAELRTACDVALRWPDDTRGLSDALTESRDIALQMSAMVRVLLSLANQQAEGHSESHLEPIPLADAVDRAWAPLHAAASDRKLTLDRKIDAAAIAKTDPLLLSAILHNLLENAVSYASAGSAISIETTHDNQRAWALHITNACDGLTASDLDQFFEPFWRKDAARTDRIHAGLGLTLVKAYCDTLRISVIAELISPDKLALTLQFSPDN